MKRISFLLTVLMLAGTLSAQSVKSIFDQHIGQDNYTFVNINGSLFEFMLADKEPESKEASFARGLEGIQIYSAEEVKDKATRKALLKDLYQYFESDRYEEFMRVEEKDDRVVFFMRQSEGKVVELTLLAEDDASVIRISGDINMAEIARLSETMDIDGMEKLEEIDDKKKR